MLAEGVGHKNPIGSARFVKCYNMHIIHGGLIYSKIIDEA
jgi:hypothetical protein